LKLRFFVFIPLFLFALLCYNAKAETRTKRFTRLIEHTYDDQLATIFRGNSVDYRSFILVKFVDSAMVVPASMKMEIEVIRKNGRGFEIPAPGYSYMTDSGAIGYSSQTYDPNQNIALKETYVQLRKWAVEPGDKIHLRIYDGVNHSYLFERYIPVKKHGLQGEISFPVFSVQRTDGHAGSLGAGISYTGKYVHRDQRLLDKLGFGVNFSFLDFEPDQKIEIGLGFVLTFPDEIFQIGAGKNLTVNHDSGYYFLGINLFGIKEKIGW
jgi:hypothetical protein